MWAERIASPSAFSEQASGSGEGSRSTRLARVQTIHAAFFRRRYNSRAPAGSPRSIPWVLTRMAQLTVLASGGTSAGKNMEGTMVAPSTDQALMTAVLVYM